MIERLTTGTISMSVPAIALLLLLFAPAPSSAPMAPARHPAPTDARSGSSAPRTSPAPPASTTSSDDGPAAARDAIPEPAPLPPEKAAARESAGAPTTSNAPSERTRTRGSAYLSVSGTGAVSLRGDSNPIGAGFRTSGGKLWTLPNALKIYAGGGYQFRRRQLGARNKTVDQFGFAMVRVGRGTDRMWGYGLLALHLGVQVPTQGDGGHFTLSALAGLEAGGGAAVTLISGLFLAGELAVELGTAPLDSRSQTQLALLNGRLMAGWAF